MDLITLKLNLKCFKRLCDIYNKGLIPFLNTLRYSEIKDINRPFPKEEIVDKYTKKV